MHKQISAPILVVLHFLLLLMVLPKIDVVQVMHSCKETAFRWRAQTTPYTLGGIDFMETVKTGNTWQISADYSEFNVGADLIDAGLFPCKTS